MSVRQFKFLGNTEFSPVILLGRESKFMPVRAGVNVFVDSGHSQTHTLCEGFTYGSEMIHILIAVLYSKTKDQSQQ